MFSTRAAAGDLLALKLKAYAGNDGVVVAIPRGGVPVGYAIAEALDLPLEIVLSKKIGHPYNKEYAIGAVTISGRILSDAAREVSTSYLDDETLKIKDLLVQRQKLYYRNREPRNLKDKTLIIVDDGIATGNTLISCIQLLTQQKPAQIIVALPVAPVSSLKKIADLPGVSSVICLIRATDFYAVGQYYENFQQVSDAEVIDLLERANSEKYKK